VEVRIPRWIWGTFDYPELFDASDEADQRVRAE
jgi:hypothetical protein